MPEVSPTGAGPRHTTRRNSSDADRVYPSGTVLLGRYRIVSLLGKGGMGEVYLADDLVLDEPVALKFLPEAAAAEAELMERFLTEVRLARKVTHPNVSRVHDIGEVDDRIFLSMEYVDGEDLHHLLRRIGRLPAEKALEISKQICEGLHAAHDRGVLHRDLKPANVMLDGDGRVRLTDFGLAELVRENSEGRMMGTPAYMSPEQITGSDCSIQSDIYSLGLLLYELFTGKRAFEGKTFADYKRMQQHEAPRAPSTLLDAVDPEVEAIILRCVEKDPDARPASARQVVQALPGGDSLAAALAGGHTPAPELVAAAGSDKAATVPVVSGLFALWLVLLAGLLALAPSDRGRELVNPDEKPTAVLHDRVATLLAEVGYRTPPMDNGDWYTMETAHREAPFARPDDELPAPLVYNYRQSPDILHRAGMALTMDDPAPNVPGMVSMRMDATGRLLQLSAVPGGVDDRARESKPVPDRSWDTLFEAAGLDRSIFVEAHEPDFSPTVHATERHEWSHSADGEPAWHVRAAGRAGLPVSFAVHPPSATLGVLAGSAASPPKDIDALVAILLLGVMGLLAWRNLRLGRGDRKGAYRVAAFVFVTHIVLWLGVQDHPGSLGAWFFTLIGGLGYDLFLAVTVYVCFLALEPVARRRWPTAMISWSRLLQGRWKDPLVGRDALAGGTLTFAFIIVLTGADRALQAMGFAGAVPRRTELGLESVHASLAVTVHDAGDAVVGALLIVLMLVLIRSVVRLPWLGALLSAAVFAFAMGFDAGYPVYDIVRDAGLGLLMCLLLTHFGILAVLVSVFVVTSTGADLLPAIGGWDGHVTVVRASVLALLGLWAWRSAVAGRPVLTTMTLGISRLASRAHH